MDYLHRFGQYGLIIILQWTSGLFAQNVFIPDSNFKKSLLQDLSINLNSDNNIQLSEAVNFSGTININNSGVSSLMGLESFINLTGLGCSYNNINTIDLSLITKLKVLDITWNPLQKLDISANSQLEYLYCGHADITDLDLSSNSKLIDVDCSSNKITSIMLPYPTQLRHLFCNDNSLTQLDVTNASELEYLWCYNNKLKQLKAQNNPSLTALLSYSNYIEELDLTSCVDIVTFLCYDNNLKSLDLRGSHPDLTFFDVNNNANLQCIQVDIPKLWDSLWFESKPPQAKYTSNCNYPTHIFEMANSIPVPVFPNPSTGLFNVQASDNALEIKIIISDLIGNILLDLKLDTHHNKQNEINISMLKKGTYIVTLIDNNENIGRSKIIVE